MSLLPLVARLSSFAEGAQGSDLRPRSLHFTTITILTSTVLPQIPYDRIYLLEPQAEICPTNAETRCQPNNIMRHPSGIDHMCRQSRCKLTMIAPGGWKQMMQTSSCMNQIQNNFTDCSPQVICIGPSSIFVKSCASLYLRTVSDLDTIITPDS